MRIWASHPIKCSWSLPSGMYTAGVSAKRHGRNIVIGKDLVPMDLQDKITAPLGLATLDEPSAETQSPEQYAIDTIGGRALQTANTIAQKSGQAIKAALAEPAAPRAVPVGDWPTYRKASGAPPYTPVTGDSFSEPVPAQNPPMQADGPPARGIDMPCPLPDRPQAPSAKQGKRTTRSKERRYIPTEERGKPPARTAPPTAKEGSNEPSRLQLYERPALATYQNTPLASGLQNQGPGLALSGESSAGLQTFQAAGQAAGGRHVCCVSKRGACCHCLSGGGESRHKNQRNGRKYCRQGAIQQADAECPGGSFSCPSLDFGWHCRGFKGRRFCQQCQSILRRDGPYAPDKCRLPSQWHPRICALGGGCDDAGIRRQRGPHEWGRDAMRGIAGLVLGVST